MAMKFLTRDEKWLLYRQIPIRIKPGDQEPMGLGLCLKLFGK